jgi:hypothetical protein
VSDLWRAGRTDGVVTVEHPDDLLRRLKLGREEYCQRLLTMLVVSGPYPPWNSRSEPTADGRRFLEALAELSFGVPQPLVDPTFVDEFDLGRRPEDLQGSAPDYAVLTEGRLWIIELKTERGSHRDAQVPTYVGTARHHHPGHQVDLTYVTGPMPSYRPDLPDGTRYAHLHWPQVLDLVRAVWGGGSPAERQAVERLEAVVSDLGVKWSEWRASRLGDRSLASDGTVPTIEETGGTDDVVTSALELAAATARDHQQRVLDHAAGSLEELRELGRDVTRAMSADRSLDHVGAWLWNAATSDGRALTSAGSETGFELRLSWYRKPQR